MQSYNNVGALYNFCLATLLESSVLTSAETKEQLIVAADF